MSERSKKLKDALDSLEGQTIALTMFEDFNEPRGFLVRKIACHALFFYFINARRAYEEKVLAQPIMYEGDPDAPVDFRHLFESIAALYSVDCEDMTKYWEPVDKMADLLGIPKMPEGDEYRFSSPLIVLLH